MTEPRNYAWLQTPAGRLLIAGDKKGIRHILFAEGRGEVRPGREWKENPAGLEEALRQLRDYFTGALRRFQLPLAPEGTPFQLRVWHELQSIPYGDTVSYGELAHRLGNPAASRAVGSANGANPIAIVIPCHRVVGSNGKLTGYGGGLPVKERLLALERGQLGLPLHFKS